MFMTNLNRVSGRRTSVGGLASAAIGIVLLAGSAASAQTFATGFEPPTYTGSTAGTSINTQDSWFTPPVVGSIDNFIFTAAGNAFNVPANPNGGEQFLAGRSGGGTSFGRAQREGITFPTLVVMSYDLVGGFGGTAPSAQNLSSFSLQPEANPAAPTSKSFIQLNTWVDPNAPTTWNAAYIPYNAAGVQILATGVTAGPEWTNLPIDRWYRLSTTVDFTLNRIVEVAITDLTTNVTTTAEPADWYVGGGATSTLPLPRGIRFFVGGGLGNTMAWDNVSIGPPPAACACDWNNDAVLNSQDFFDFLVSFFSNDADFNNDTFTNSQDFFDFLTCFFARPAGCV